ncbi:class I adenylate-forming enzyme family protein [Zwartia vadi]|uniref:class I adenylate-forming enzyme family protein n=1 Tax=Zwartia vadi TaxID=3058168 RepID=UPI0025B3E785|nr:long-chain-fatty-acid--CoA ligase [Zwartia vadi]MDN3988810.1 long-chain-fatty-acid--CoA ligase [Zwartia vadi]
MYLTAGLHRSIQRHPEKVATVSGGRRQTYAELIERVARTASLLKANGLKAGDRLAIISQNSDRMIELLLAAWWSGLVVQPVNTRWSPAEMAYAMTDSRARALATCSNLLSTVQAIESELPELVCRFYMDDDQEPVGYIKLSTQIITSPTIEDVRCATDDLAAIVYTGGTTGKPKGVMLSHGNFWSSLVGRMVEVPSSPQSVTLLTSPMFHVAGLSRMILQVLLGGTSVALPGFQPQSVIELIRQEGVHDLMLVPSMLQMLMSTANFDPEYLPTLNKIFWGAAPITMPLLQQALERFPKVEFVHSYAMTETAASISALTVLNNPSFLKSNRLRSVGRGTLSSEIRIADAQGKSLPSGTTGEILLRGPGIMKGYWHKPVETAETFIDGWLKSGDVGYLDEEGYLFVTDRMKDMIISGGENIYPAEVETVICSHPSVSACAVIGVPHERWGEAVHAVIVLHQGLTITEETLLAYCRQSLSRFKSPKSFEIRESLPLTAAGKIDKKLLRTAHT